MSDFSFKEFTIRQTQTAMKVGTDGVLLGAWTSLDGHPESILDIGTGTGLIALQLAQRSDAELIDAIEIDDQAYEEAVFNFEHSDWSDRLFCYHCSLQEFIEEIEDPYDLIVANPPFYQEENTTDNEARSAARSTVSLPFAVLIEGVSKLLSKTGTFNVILPSKEYELVKAMALAKGLFVNRCCFVRGNPTSPEKRVLIQFSFRESEILRTALTIELDRHIYTPEYIALVKDFYMKM